MGDTDKLPLWRIMREANVSAEAVRIHFRAEEAPIAVGRIASGMGIELSESAGAPIAGQLVLSNNRATIWTCTDEAKEQRRYTLAYLVGQALRMPFGEYRLPLGHETYDATSEVSIFARELLMPREVLRRLLFEGGGQDDAGIAQRLGVTIYQLALRIQELDLPRPLTLASKSPVDFVPTQPVGGSEDEDVEQVDDSDVVDQQPTLTDGRGDTSGDDHTQPAGYAQRREYERVEAKVEIRFSLPGQAANALRAYSRDISMGGLCLRTSKSHPVGSMLELTMLVGNEPYQLRARVAWVREGAVGVRFVDVDARDQERLDRIIKTLKP